MLEKQVVELYKDLGEQSADTTPDATFERLTNISRLR